MSKKHLLVVVLIVLAGALTLSVIGQEEPMRPMPVVLAKGSTRGLIDPTLEFRWPTLAESAKRNDYVSFSAVYLEAKARGESVAEFDTLYDLWTWSMADPIGAFYGRDIHDRLASAYPEFERYIADYSIIDDRGNTFYPTSETRTFLLERAITGTPSPRVMIAETRTFSVASPQEEERPLSRPSAATTPRRGRRAVTKAARSAPAASEVPATSAPTVTTPVIERSTPAVQTPAVTTSAPAPVSIPAPAPIVAEPPVVSAEEPQAVEQESGLPSRGILLIVIGLIGIGLLAVILRTPKETTRATILGPNTTDKPPAPVEPIRRTQAPGSVKGEEKSRATGSRG